MTDETVTISYAKANLSKLVKRAEAGETIYVGSYGQPRAVIAPLAAKKQIKIGALSHKFKPDAYDYDELVGSDSELNSLIEKGINRPFPYE